MRVAELFDVSGLVAVVTGGASGIGLANAEAMAADGARVTILDLDGTGVEREVRRLREAGGAVSGAVVDVTDRPRLRAAFDAVAAAEARLDVVFANAGIDSPLDRRDAGRRLVDVPDATWDCVLDVNLTGVFSTIRAAAAHMRAGGRGGSIVVTSSVAATRPSAIAPSPYMPSKVGVSHLVRQAALELAPDGIRVNSIAPAVIVTNIGDGHSRDPVVQEPIARATPLGRIGQPRDLAGAALLLASPASAYMTGVEIVVDGGRTHGLLDRR